MQVSNAKLLSGVTAEFIRQFKKEKITALRASLLLGITPAAASFYFSGKRGAGVELKPGTVRFIRRAVLNAQVPRAELYRACLIEVLTGQVIIKTRKPKKRGDGSDKENDWYPETKIDEV